MERLIFYVAMFCSKKYLVNIHSMDWYREFYSESKKYLERARKEDSSNPIIMEHLSELADAEQL